MEKDGGFEATEEAEGFVGAIGSVEGGHEGVVLEGAVRGIGNEGVGFRVRVWFEEFLVDGEESGEEVGRGGGGRCVVGGDGGGGVRTEVVLAGASAVEVEEIDEEI